MELVKKNMVSIICGVVVLLSVVALFWPIGGYYSELRDQVQQRTSVYNSLAEIARKERHWPVVELTAANPQPVRLEQFPNEAIVSKGTQIMEQVTKQAQAMLDAAVRLNARQQLVSGALPEGPPLPLGTFRSEYLKKFDFMSDRNRAVSFPVQIMKAGFPPTEQQIAEAKAKKAAEINNERAFGPGGQVINQQMIEAKMNEELPKVADQLKAKAAAECQVYIEPTALDPYLGWGNIGPGAVPDRIMIFNAQVNLWIHEDVARAIAEANKESKSVGDSPVKHLLKIDLPDEIFPSANPGQMAEGQPAPSNDPSQTLTKNFAVSPTGRISNGVYDVVDFVIRLNVDAEQLPRVLMELSRNRFITVTNCSVTTVDSALMQANGYFYGTKPVISLDLQCEALLLRKWTEPLMPTRIKQALGIAPPPEQPVAQ